MSIQTDWEPTRVEAKERDSDLWTPKPPVQRPFDVAFDPTLENHGHNVGGVFSHFAPSVPWTALGLALTALIALGGATFVFVTGLLGNEWKHVQYDYSLPGIKTGSGSGHSIGLNTFYFLEGQQLLIEYETDIHAGYLQIWARKVFAPFNKGTLLRQAIRKSEIGETSITIKEGGLYSIDFDARPEHFDLDGYDVDLTYSVTWSVR